jgi:Protein of unknown function (DUF642)
MLRQSALALVTSLMAGHAALAAGPDLLVNGGFESPGLGYTSLPGNSTFIEGWTTVLSGVEYYSAGSGAASGTMVVDLANYTYLQGGGLQQAFATTPGAVYTLGFWAGNVQASGRDGSGEVRVQVGNVDQTFATAVATSGAYAWRWIDVAFTAQAASTMLTFSNTQNPWLHFAVIDGASVSAVPEPGSVVLLCGGLLALGARARSARAHRLQIAA